MALDAASNTLPKNCLRNWTDPSWLLDRTLAM